MIDPKILESLEQRDGLPPGTLRSVMQVESGGDPAAQSPKGALGLFQLMPGTAQQYGANPLDPQQSADAASRYLGDLQRQFGSIDKALAAYNWGPGNLSRKGMENAPQETQNYVPKVLAGIGNMLVPTANASEVDRRPLEDTIDVEMPDGTIIQDVPPGTTQSKLMEMMKKTFPEQKTKGQMATESAQMELATEKSPLAAVGGHLAGALQDIPIIGPWTDEVISGAEALRSLINDGVSFGKTYEGMQQAQRALRTEQAKQEIENPDLRVKTPSYLPDITAAGVSSVGANIAGLPILMRSVPEGGVLKQAASMALLGGLQGAGREEGGGRIGNASEDAALWGALSAAFPAVGSVIGKPVSRAMASLSESMRGRGVPTLDPRSAFPVSKAAKVEAPIITEQATSENLKQMARPLYQQVDESGAKLKPEFVDDFIGKTKSALTEPERVTAAFGKTAPVKIASDIESVFAGKSMTLGEATAINKRLSEEIESHILPNGAPDAIGKQIFDMQTKLRDGLKNAAKNGMIEGDASAIKAWENAQALWHKSMQLNDFERIFARAETSQNPQSAINQGFKALYNSKRIKGYDKQTQALIKKMTQPGLTVEAMRAMGSRLTAIGSGILGGAAGGPLGMAAATAGTAVIGAGMRKGAAAIEKARAQDVKRAILGLKNPAKPFTASGASSAELAQEAKKKVTK